MSGGDDGGGSGGGGGGSGGGGGMMGKMMGMGPSMMGKVAGMKDDIFSGAENAPDIDLAEFSESLSKFVDKKPIELPKPAELLKDMGFLTPRDGFGKESGTDAFVDPAKLDEMKPYPGIDYSGMGYDIFHGNPEADEKSMNDPGFKLPIRKLSYVGVSTTRDNKFLTPDKLDVDPAERRARAPRSRAMSRRATGTPIRSSRT